MGWYDGMQPDYAKRLEAFIAASGGRIGVFSGYRSVEEQQALWDASDQTGKWVAPPGKSNHNHGIAADLSYETDDARDWAHANAARFGLHFPMDYEPWHIEPFGSVETADPQAYTTPPTGYTHPQDGTKRASMGYQLQSMNNLLLQVDPSILAGPSGGGMLNAPGGGSVLPGVGMAQGADAATPTFEVRDGEEEMA